MALAAARPKPSMAPGAQEMVPDEDGAGDAADGSTGGQAFGIAARYLLSELTPGTTEEAIREYFGIFGEIEEVSVKEVSEEKITGSVKFANPTMDLRKVMLQEKHEIQGKLVKVTTWKMQKTGRTGQGAKGKFDPWGAGGKGKGGKYWDMPMYGKGWWDPWDPYGWGKGYWDAGYGKGGGKGGGGKGDKDDGKNKDITARYLLQDLPEELSEEAIHAYFSTLGAIEEVSVKKLENSGRINGSVKFSSPTMDLRNQMLKETHTIDGHEVKVCTWKMQKMNKPNWAVKREEETAKYYAKMAEKKGGKGWGKGYSPYDSWS